MADTNGMSSLDLMSVSPAMRRLIRILLKNPKSTRTELYAKFAELPMKKRPEPEAIDEALEELINMGWVLTDKGPEGTIYMVKVSKKEGSDVTRSGERGNRGQSNQMEQLWDAVDSGSKAADDGRRAQKEMTDYQRERSEGSDDVTQPLPNPTQHQKKRDDDDDRSGFFNWLNNIFGG